MNFSRQDRLYALNPFTKLCLALALVLCAFIAPGLHTPMLIFVAIIVPISMWSGISKAVLKSCVQMVLPAAVTLFVLQGLLYPGGKTPLFAWGFLVIKWEGVLYAYRLTGQLLAMVGGFELLLETTHSGVLMSALQQKGFPPSMAYLVSSALQLVPHTHERAQAILAAQRARGLRTRGSLLGRAAGILPLVAPLVYSILIISDERALALEARAFRCGRRPTSWQDFSDHPVERTLRWFCLSMVIFSIGWRTWQLLN